MADTLICRYLKKSASLAVLMLPLLLSSCTGMRSATRMDTAMQPVTAPSADITVFRQDAYHTVAPGETLWRISQMYDVDVETIKKANRVYDVTTLDIGQRLHIPNAAPRVEVVTLYPSNKWKYIIIHHSATDKGNCQLIDNAHKGRGWNCVGYHFVIDNGTSGKDDGQIEISPRWTKQEDGAHCKADDMNERGIGICVVGNFSTGEISDRQMRSLVYLVKQLKDYYRIKDSRILGHNQVRGAQTECPGKNFPWKRFWAMMNK